MNGGLSKQTNVGENYDSPLSTTLHLNPGWKISFDKDGEIICFTKKSKEEFNLLERIVLQ